MNAETDRTYDVTTPHLSYDTPPLNLTRSMEGRVAVSVIDGPTLILSSEHLAKLRADLERLA
jgi:hypothetical protein